MFLWFNPLNNVTKMPSDYKIKSITKPLRKTYFWMVLEGFFSQIFSKQERLNPDL